MENNSGNNFYVIFHFFKKKRNKTAYLPPYIRWRSQMKEINIPVKLVYQAQMGQKDSLDRLADVVWAPLRSYIYRRIIQVTS